MSSFALQIEANRMPGGVVVRTYYDGVLKMERAYPEDYPEDQFLADTDKDADEGREAAKRGAVVVHAIYDGDSGRIMNSVTKALRSSDGAPRGRKAELN